MSDILHRKNIVTPLHILTLSIFTYIIIIFFIFYPKEYDSNPCGFAQQRIWPWNETRFKIVFCVFTLQKGKWKHGRNVLYASCVGHMNGFMDMRTKIKMATSTHSRSQTDLTKLAH